MAFIFDMHRHALYTYLEVKSQVESMVIKVNVRYSLYNMFEANFPRLKTDKFFADYKNTYQYSGFINDAIKFTEDNQLLDKALWKRFVQQFREDADFDAGWRGEYWGKLMRGACFVYSYTRNKQLYDILTNTICEMINSQDADGRISSYGKSHEFDGWDIWSRKYVLLGMQYYIEICTDESLTDKIIQSMKKQTDYIMSKIGNESEGKMPITAATRNWRGLNSSSLLEPVVRLYNITQEKRYFEFAQYIVNEGGTDVANIFDIAYQNELYPYQYPVTKAYEMISCFEGLIEFYRITGVEKYKKAVINFADKILESDFTVIGSSGCTHELFDHSSVRQANPSNGKIKQETCVTVTLMKFFYQLNILTGDSKYADAFEISLYNAYLGSMNTEKILDPIIGKEHPEWEQEALPFDSYSPLTSGTRGNGIGGLKNMSDNHYYGCCACISAAGIGLVPKMQMLATYAGFAVNLYISGTVKAKSPSGKCILFSTFTDYPAVGSVNIKIESENKKDEISEEFEILLRNPVWSKKTEIKLNGTDITSDNGYISIKKIWQNGDTIEMTFDMSAEIYRPVPYGSDILMNKVVWNKNYMINTFDKEDPIAHKHIAIRRGPIMLAQENRLGYDVDEPINIKTKSENIIEVVPVSKDTIPYQCIFAGQIPLAGGNFMTVTDYASAGKLWCNESKMAVWMLTD